MLHLTLKSEYSFGECYGFLKELHDNYSENGYIGIADSNTFSFFKLQKLCEKSGVKPIYGYRCTVVKDATEKVKPRGSFGKQYIIIAKNLIGIREIFKLTKIKSQNFYYRGNISISDIDDLSKNVIVISSDPITERLDYIGIDFTTIPKVLAYDFPKVFIDQNYHSIGEDKPVYQLYAGTKSEDRPYPQHILSEKEAIIYFGKDCILNLQRIVDSIDDFKLPIASNIKYNGDIGIYQSCLNGAKTLSVDLDNIVYKERLNKEIKLIEEKGYSDYLMAVAEIIEEGKKHSLMGPGRGSSGGSLVCYLLSITTFDPIKYNLIFERFIDINRYDPPDVDFDVPDKSRAKLIKWMEKKYGIDNVKTISNITRFKPKSAIGEFAKAMQIPIFETEAVKDVIIARAAGDARAAFALKDTFENTDIGKEFVEKFPNMKLCTEIENHAKNKGKHAAGVIICNDVLTEYCGIDERDGTVYLDKKDAEALNLLKIDVLGLKTLSVLQDCAKSIGMDYNNFYNLPLDDDKVYEVFKSKRLQGIFQFTGEAMKSINDSAPMECFEDIAACGALGRPGALSSGGTSRYIQLKNGKREPLYYCEKHKKITEKTYGITVFQEDMMNLCREISGMSWEDVSSLRKAASKSLGEEYFEQYRLKFVNGAMELSGYDEETANKAWLDISSFGSYAFNRSHSVAYGMISYWCAWCKAYYSIEFAAALLNNSNDDEVSLQILRDLYEYEDLKFVAVDTKNSNTKWEIIGDKLVGGLTNIKSIGANKALDMIKIRNGKKKMTPAMKMHFENPQTPFDVLYPCIGYFYDLYKNPRNYGVEKITFIRDISDEQNGEYTVIGKMIHVDDVNVNDVQSIAKRGGEILDGPNMKVHARIQDDTGVLMVIVNRFIYNQIASEFLEGKAGETYYCVKGKVLKGTKILFLSEVANLNNQVGLISSEDRTNDEYKQFVLDAKNDFEIPF